jgi:hypothetical protein
MDCERSGCGHPLAIHDPCTATACPCRAYEPADRKARVAVLTDVEVGRQALKSIRADERKRLRIVQ